MKTLKRLFNAIVPTSLQNQEDAYRLVGLEEDSQQLQNNFNYLMQLDESTFEQYNFKQKVFRKQEACIFEEIEGEKGNRKRDKKYIDKQISRITQDNYITEQNEEQKQQLVRSKKQDFLQKQKLMLNSIQQFEDIMCTICQDYIIGCKIAICGHSFCEQCLQEWLLRKKICPVCRKDIRKYKLQQSKIIDNIVSMIIEKKQQESLEEYNRYQERMKNYQNWIDSLKVREVKAGDKLDIKDTEHIWCVGVVELKITTENYQNLLYIHYEGWNRRFDEYIYLTSKRIAPLGTYTNRSDIPRYQYCPHQNMLFSQLVQGINENNGNEQQRAQDQDQQQNQQQDEQNQNRNENNQEDNQDSNSEVSQQEEVNNQGNQNRQEVRIQINEDLFDNNHDLNELRLVFQESGHDQNPRFIRDVSFQNLYQNPFEELHEILEEQSNRLNSQRQNGFSVFIGRNAIQPHQREQMEQRNQNGNENQSNQQDNNQM